MKISLKSVYKFIYVKMRYLTQKNSQENCIKKYSTKSSNQIPKTWRTRHRRSIRRRRRRHR